MPRDATPIFFPEKENGRRPSKRKAFPIASEQLEELQCLPNRLPARSEATFSIAIRLASASIIRCCAAVGGSDALRMRHTPCGCRSAHLVEVRSNSRLPPVSAMRRAKQCRYFARSPPPSKRHSRLTIVRRGCKTVTIRRDSWRSHVHRTRLRSVCSSSSCKLPMSGVEGTSPRVLLGERGIFSHVREYPPFSVQRLRRCFSPCALWAQKAVFPLSGK